MNAMSPLISLKVFVCFQRALLFLALLFLLRCFFFSFFSPSTLFWFFFQIRSFPPISSGSLLSGYMLSVSWKFHCGKGFVSSSLAPWNWLAGPRSFIGGPHVSVWIGPFCKSFHLFQRRILRSPVQGERLNIVFAASFLWAECSSGVFGVHSSSRGALVCSF